MPRAKKSTISLDKSVDDKLKHFKKVFDVVVEEDINFNDYTNTVISIGLDTMLRTVIPEGQEWSTLQSAFETRYETMCELIAEMWQKDIRNEKDAKSRIRKGMEEYIR
jgi:hypothetical protein